MRKFYNLLLVLMTTLVLGKANAQVELSYCTDIAHGFGSNGVLYTPYVQFPSATVQPYAGATLTRVLIGLKSSVTNVTLYIKNAPNDTRPIYTQTVGQLQAGWNEVVLTTPYVIPAGEDLAIGYRARLTQDGGIAYSSVRNSLAEQVLINQSSQWTTLSGAVCMRAILEGDALPAHELSIDRISDFVVDPEQADILFEGSVHNRGTATVHTYGLSCMVDGEHVQSFHVNCDMPVNATDTFQVQIPMQYGFGQHSVSIAITSVNGEADSYAADDVTDFQIKVPDPRFVRRAVCEEYTGLWCGWCPKGIVGLELMKEEFPDRFIAISIHGGQGDGLEIPQDSSYTYYDFWMQFPGAPACKMNRRLSGDPFYDIHHLYRMETSAENHVALTTEAMWNADSTSLTITSELMTDIDVETSPYHVAYIVLEDGITGYVQTNYFAGGANGVFYGWEEKSGYTLDVVFNDIARGIFGGINGSPCIDGPLTAMQPQTFQATISLPAAISNKANVHVATIIIDSRSGFIQNGHNTWPEADPAAITEVMADAQSSTSTGTERVRYDLQGRRSVRAHGFLIHQGQLIFRP